MTTKAYVSNTISELTQKLTHNLQLRCARFVRHVESPEDNSPIFADKRLSPASKRRGRSKRCNAKPEQARKMLSWVLPEHQAPRLGVSSAGRVQPGVFR
jgi:hypothetical protein